ncbi:MAG: hypothetical protein GF311_19945 [Candidatus Lokiarchaeota archaeon]|nr:hypothetical protein [Candidatus Lokiarchaeota archaeon]
MNKLAERKVKNFYTQQIEEKPKKLNEKVLENVPPIIQNYLKKINILDKQEIKRVRFKQRGKFKFGPNSKWKAYTAEQYINTENLSFLWYAKIRMMPLINFHVIDDFICGKGELKAKVCNLITVVDEMGSNLDEGEFLRFLGEMFWYPSFFLDRHITLKSIDNRTIQARLNLEDLDVSGKFLFDDSNLIREFTTNRYYTKKGRDSLEKWHGYLEDYKEFDGIRIPSKFKVCWDLDDGEYCYIKGKVVDIKFNKPLLY